MVKKINYKKFLMISIGLSIIIFTAGLLLGISLDDTKVNDLVLNLNQNELNTESYSIEKDFSEVFGGDICILSSPRIKSLSEELGKIGRLLTQYESTKIVEESEFTYLKRKYFLLELKAYSLFTSLKKKCNYNYTNILFFYDKDDKISSRQGYILDTFVKLNPNTNVFSFDRNFKEDPTFETLKLHYNITNSPTLIINNEIRKNVLVDLDELINLTNGQS
jgi:hypothetical protein